MPTESPRRAGGEPASAVYNGTMKKQPSTVQLKKRAAAVKFCGCGRLIGMATVRSDTCGRKECQ